MKKQALSLAVLAAGAFPVASHALSLGDIQSNSNLNQPFQARIELLATNPQEVQNLRVRVAPPQVFQRVGIERPAFLDQLRFTTRVEGGRPVIWVSSNTPIPEPFVNFLLEVSWPNGQLLKEYTVMLDPPVLMQPGTSFANNNGAAVRPDPQAQSVARVPQAPRPAQPAQQQRQLTAQQQAHRQRQLAIQRQRQAAQQQARARQQQQARRQQLQRQRQAQANRARAPQRMPANGVYRVRRGDTLSKVAERMLQPGVTLDQMMLGLFRANPNAFINGNINGLKAGARLRMPNANTLRASGPRNARREVVQQHAQWREMRSQVAQATASQRKVSDSLAGTDTTVAASDKADSEKPRLEVRGQGAQDSTNAAAGSGNLTKIENELASAKETLVTRQKENTELRSRITDLENMLRKKNRLIALRDNQLAELQQKLGVDVPEVDGEEAAAETDSAEAVRQEILEQAGMASDTASDAADSAVEKVGGALEAGSEKAADMAGQAKEAVKVNKPKMIDSPFADEQEDSWLSMLMSPLLWLLGGLLLIGLGLWWLLKKFLGGRKSAKAAKLKGAEAGLYEQAQHDIEANEAHLVTQTDDTPFSQLDADLDEAESRMGAGDHLTSVDVASMKDVNAEGAVAVSDFSGDAVEHDADEEDDVLAESRVYISYGLHQQAEAELQGAIEKYPDRLVYRHQLLENYFVANDPESFNLEARQLSMKLGDTDNEMWQQVCEWGRKLSPDNALYHGKTTSATTDQGEQNKGGVGMAAAGLAGLAGAAGLAASGSAEEPTSDLVDLDTDFVDTNSGDFDLPDLPQAEVNTEADDIEAFDFNMGDESTPEMTQAIDNGFDFDLPELEGGDEDDVEEIALSTSAEDQDELVDLEGLLTESDKMDEIQSDELFGAVPEESDLLDLDRSTESVVSDGFDTLEDSVNVETDSNPFEVGALSGGSDIDLPELPVDDNHAALGQDIDLESLGLSEDDAPVSDADKGDGLLGGLGLAAGAAGLAGAAGSALGGVKDKAGGALGGLGDGLGGLKDSASGALGGVKDKASGALGGLGDGLGGLKDSASGALGGVKDKASGALGGLGDGLGGLKDSASGALGGVKDKASGALGGLGDGLGGLKDSASGALGGVKDKAGGALGGLGDGLGGLKDSASGALGGVKDKASGALGGLGDDLGDLKDSASDTASGLSEGASDLGINVKPDNGLDNVVPNDSMYASGSQPSIDVEGEMAFMDDADDQIDMHKQHISTKLDLARAYIDMGDMDGARSTLEEVMVEGNDAQRREAEELLHQTG